MPNRDSLSHLALRATVLALFAVGALPASAGLAQDRATMPQAAPSSPPTAAPMPPSSAPAPSSPGMKVNIDPATGRFLDEPAADGAAQKRAAEPAPVVMEPSPVPGGGVGFRVPDQRYDSEMKATVAPDGKPSIACDGPAK